MDRCKAVGADFTILIGVKNKMDENPAFFEQNVDFGFTPIENVRISARMLPGNLQIAVMCR